MVGNSVNHSVVARIVSTMPCIGMGLVSPLFGHFSDKYGINNALELGFILAIIFLIPQGLAPGVLFSGILRECSCDINCFYTN